MRYDDQGDHSKGLVIITGRGATKWENCGIEGFGPY